MLILELLFLITLPYHTKALTKFETEALNTHNNYRKNHGSPPLKWNATLAKYAMVYAKTLAAANSSNRNPARLYGKNVYHAAKWKVNGKVPVDSWYNETKAYNFKNPGFNTKSSNFTQVIWRDSRQLGMAFFTTPKNTTWVVANYYPNGNIVEEYSVNVYPKGTTLKAIEAISQKFQKDALTSHNEYRKAHSTPPLKWSDKLTKYALQYAKVLAKIDKMIHNPASKYGENLFYSIKTGLNGKLPVYLWYREVKDYNYKNPVFSHLTGHFTQVIWKNSKEMGMSWMKTDKGKIWIVAYYDPPGNFRNKFRENVLPKKQEIKKKG